ncbi:MAG: hypothetical protein DMG65_00680 [Candidatus Angelobacter sp. Gp1-AA117]|nr:MAG: hypothetical protein DMG65_00680 [Candidatus Angelobacter sp. Gp1-AA117]
MATMMRATDVMAKNDPAIFHKLYGTKRPRVVYYKKDFVDYVLMILLSALAIIFSYGFSSAMSIAGLVLCGFMLVTFVMRHGAEFRIPAVFRKPHELFYMFAYKLQNLKSVYFIALGLLLLENLLIAATPNLPHHVEGIRKVALYLFYAHFLSITLYRTAILIDHLLKKELVREILMQTAWQRVIKQETNITLEIIHAYCIGVLTHIVLIAPWYLVIIYAKFSVIFLPVVLGLNVLIHMRWAKVLNAWFYRDHWLGHNSELEFIFLHGTHHDAIPSGLIAVAENGFLEGFLRHTIGFPTTFYNPILTFVIYMYDTKIDIDTHQYIPGIFPRMPRKLLEVAQHSTHHYGPLEPYSIGLKFDGHGDFKDFHKGRPDEIRNSIRLDEELTGFRWDNPTFRQILSLYDKYHNN